MHVFQNMHAHDEFLSPFFDAEYIAKLKNYQIFKLQDPEYRQKFLISKIDFSRYFCCDP